MKKKLLTLLVLVCTLSLGGVAHAEGLEPLVDPLVNPVVVDKKKPEPKPKPVIKKPKPTTYVIKQNDTLVNIARKHKTTWQRLYYKNKNIKHPDLIVAGNKLVIPTKKEKLKHRKLPRIAPRSSYKPSGSVSGSTSSNTYPDSSQCVWWAMQRRIDIGRPIPHWGNAYLWYSKAQSQGWPTGSTPRQGAVGVGGNHVVFVERVNSNGTIYISERNYDWNGSTRYITVPANKYNHYIY